MTIDQEPAEVLDAQGRNWTRRAPFVAVLADDEPMTMPPGWQHDGTTYFALEHLAEAYGPLTLPDGTAFDLCRNGHPFEPGRSVDAPGTPDDSWCDMCGEARVTPFDGTAARTPPVGAHSTLLVCGEARSR